LDTQNTIDPMLIACPSCSTSYMSEPASLGPGGRTVRCARCKTTWFADASNTMPEMAAAADGAINESEVQGSPGAVRPGRGTSRTGSDAEPAQESAEAAQAMVRAFSETLDLAAESGVNFSGVLCGRATGKDGIPVYAKHGVEAFRKWLQDEGVKNINNVNERLKAATSWHSIYEAA
jgi:predicted Zn finger-like uncharacterized protein